MDIGPASLHRLGGVNITRDSAIAKAQGTMHQQHIILKVK